MTTMTLFRNIWMTNGCQIQNQRTKLPLGTQKSEKWLMTSSKVIDLWWPRLTSEWSQCQCKPWVSPRNTYPCPYHQQKYRSSQVSGVETVRNVHFAWHDLGDKVTGQKSWQVRPWHFQKRCKIVQWIGTYPKFRDDRPIRSRAILGKPERVVSTSPLCRRGLTCLAVEITKKWPSRGHVCW